MNNKEHTETKEIVLSLIRVQGNLNAGHNFMFYLSSDMVSENINNSK